MAKLILSALLRPRREGVEAKIAEFPDIKVSAWSIGVALARLREAIWSKLRWTKIETSCAGEPISPVPEKSTNKEVTVPNRGRDLNGDSVTLGLTATIGLQVGARLHYGNVTYLAHLARSTTISKLLAIRPECFSWFASDVWSR